MFDFMCFWIYYQWSQSKYLILWLTSFICVMCIANHFLLFVVQNSIVWVYHNLLLNSIADEKYFFPSLRVLNTMLQWIFFFMSVDVCAEELL